jgi:hypothetical protein
MRLVVEGRRTLILEEKDNGKSQVLIDHLSVRMIWAFLFSHLWFLNYSRTRPISSNMKEESVDVIGLEEKGGS